MAGCGGAGQDAWPAGLPAGFVDEQVARVSEPTDFAFTPDGRMLIITKAGAVRVYLDGRLLSPPALALASVCTERERGLTGIAIDPAFRRNGFVYLYYTFDKFGGCAVDVPRGPVNRLVRYVLRPDDRLDPRSATILLDNIPSFHAIHNAGALEFGRDGLLYVGVGDGGHDYALRTRSSALNAAARDMNVLLGKVLRITAAGRIPPGNPSLGSGTTPCATRGRAAPGLICGEIFASGLRNPFRIAMDRDAPGVRFFINDVGQNVWEEINVGRAGADYGWNLREGRCPRAVRVRCPPPVPPMQDPIYAYGHNGCRSITGGAFVPAGVWPDAYRGSYLYSDFICGKIFRLRREGGTWRQTLFASGLSTPVTLRFGPEAEAEGRALYYASFGEGGQIRKILYRGGRT